MDDNRWTVVTNKKRIMEAWSSPSEKILEPCWFYNNGGCRNKDGTIKPDNECKYLHIYSEKAKKPVHVNMNKPCDKYNLEGECKWFNECKYSHRDLTSEEWSKYYPGVPFTIKTNMQKRVQFEQRMTELENNIETIHCKQDGISRDVQILGQQLKQLLRTLKEIHNMVMI